MPPNRFEKVLDTDCNTVGCNQDCDNCSGSDGSEAQHQQRLASFREDIGETLSIQFHTRPHPMDKHFEADLKENPTLLQRLADRYSRGTDYPNEVLKDMRAAARMFFIMLGALPNPDSPSDYREFLHCVIDHFKTVRAIEKRELVVVTEDLLVETARQFAQALHCTRIKQQHRILEAVKVTFESTGELLNPTIRSQVAEIGDYIHRFGGTDN